MKKKIVSTLLALTMILGCGATAFADAPAADFVRAVKGVEVVEEVDDTAAAMATTIEIYKEKWVGEWITVRITSWIGSFRVNVYAVDYSNGYDGQILSQFTCTKWGTYDMWTGTACQRVKIDASDEYEIFRR